MGSPDKETRNTCDRAQQGKPPPSSASSGASPHGYRWRIGVTKRMNREGCHPRPWVPWDRQTSCHERRLASQDLATTGLFFGVLVPVGPQTPLRTTEVTWCFFGSTPSLSRYGSVEKIRSKKKNKHILLNDEAVHGQRAPLHR